MNITKSTGEKQMRDRVMICRVRGVSLEMLSNTMYLLEHGKYPGVYPIVCADYAKREEGPTHQQLQVCFVKREDVVGYLIKHVYVGIEKLDVFPEPASVLSFLDEHENDYDRETFTLPILFAWVSDHGTEFDQFWQIHPVLNDIQRYDGKWFPQGFLPKGYHVENGRYVRK